MDTEKMEKEAVDKAKKIAKLLSYLLLKALKPFLPYIGIILVIFIILTMLIAAVYSAMPQSGSLEGINESEKDSETREKYINLSTEYNVKDTWLINRNPCTPGGDKHEPDAGNPFYPEEGIRKIGMLADPYGSDSEVALKWGEIHAASLYKAYNNNQEKITGREEVAQGLRPFFYYKQSYVYVTSPDGDGGTKTERHIQYLLVEAYTIQGHYQYHYDWVTRSRGSGENEVTITKEELDSSRQIAKNKWERLEHWLAKTYGLEKDNSIALARKAVWEAGFSFNEQKEWLDWLLKEKNKSEYISAAMIPPELMPYFREAEEEYGIPWWFLASMAHEMSSFNPQEEDNESGAFGLMQFSPADWETVSSELGFDSELDKYNAKAQILCGAYILSESGLEGVDWEGRRWQDDAIGILKNSGFDSNVNEILDTAFMFRRAENITWPVPGWYQISSPFGPRFHPILREWRDHEGIDIAAPTGEKVASVSSGVVTDSGWIDGYGKTVVVKDNRHRYLYAHLSSITVNEGESVSPDSKIGEVGETGRTDGAHLHLGVYDLERQSWIDPMLLLQGQRG